MDLCFVTYATLYDKALEYFERTRPRNDDEPEPAYRRAIRAKALDTVRGLLPAATESNVGIHGSGKRSRHWSSGSWATSCARPNRRPSHAQRTAQDDPGVRTAGGPARSGGETIRHAQATKQMQKATARTLQGDSGDMDGDVRLLLHNPQAELNVLAGLAYEESETSLEKLLDVGRDLKPTEVSEMLAAYADTRTNRRHKVGRGLEPRVYTFEVTGDYGAFRDLQRHRMLTIQWQKLSTRHGYSTPYAIVAMGRQRVWDRAMDAARKVHRQLEEAAEPTVAQYAGPMAYRIQFLMRLNAREAAHMIEPADPAAGPPLVPTVCQRMHDLIRDTAATPASPS